MYAYRIVTIRYMVCVLVKCSCRHEYLHTMYVHVSLEAFNFGKTYRQSNTHVLIIINEGRRMICVSGNNTLLMIMFL